MDLRVRRGRRRPRPMWRGAVALGLALGLYSAALLALGGARAGGDRVPRVARPDAQIAACQAALDVSDEIVSYSVEAAALAGDAIDALEAQRLRLAEETSNALAALEPPINAAVGRYLRDAQRCREEEGGP